MLPSPYLELRCGNAEVFRLKTFEWIFVSGNPSPVISSDVVFNPIASVTRLVAELSEYTIINRIASRSEIQLLCDYIAKLDYIVNQTMHVFICM